LQRVGTLGQRHSHDVTAPAFGADDEFFTQLARAERQDFFHVEASHQKGTSCLVWLV